MILSDGTIRAMLAERRIVLEPIEDEQIQPCSVDVRLGTTFMVYRSHRHTVVDPYDKPADLMEEVSIPMGEEFVLHPGEFALASTIERIELPADVVARCEGKSSLARCGLAVHVTAGFVDAGFKGNVVLELFNVAPLPILLRPGMRIGQFSFELLDKPAERPYGHPALNSKYQGQEGTVASQYDRNRRLDADDLPETTIGFTGPNVIFK